MEGKRKKRNEAAAAPQSKSSSASEGEDGEVMIIYGPFGAKRPNGNDEKKGISDTAPPRPQGKLFSSVDVVRHVLNDKSGYLALFIFA